MDTEIDLFLEQLVNACPAVQSIWLIGSRANGTAAQKSDWDFIAFGTESAYSCLESLTHLHRADTDFLVVTNGEDFRNAWGEKDKGGCLSGWEWTAIDDGLCQYTQVRFEENEEESRMVRTRKRALRVWPRGNHAP